MREAAAPSRPGPRERRRGGERKRESGRKKKRVGKNGKAAQRRKKGGLLHQGTISLFPPPKELVKPVIKEEKLYQAMAMHSDYLTNYRPELNLKQLREETKKAIAQVFFHFFKGRF